MLENDWRGGRLCINRDRHNRWRGGDVTCHICSQYREIVRRSVSGAPFGTV